MFITSIRALVAILLIPAAGIATAANDVRLPSRDQALETIATIGHRDYLRSTESQPETFLKLLLASIDAGQQRRFIHFLASTDDTRPWFDALLEDAPRRLALDRVAVDDPLSLLMHAIRLDRDLSSGLELLSELVLLAYRQDRDLGGVLASQGFVNAYRHRFLHVVGSRDYAQRARGRWCDRAGLPVRFEEEAIHDGSEWLGADYELVLDDQDESPALAVTYRNGVTGRFYLRYQPGTDRLFRAFRFQGLWRPLVRCGDPDHPEARPVASMAPLSSGINGAVTGPL